MHRINGEVNLMQAESKKIVLPLALQKEMLKYFLRTSIVRKQFENHTESTFCTQAVERIDPTKKI
jgi:hypothetical protein